MGVLAKTAKVDSWIERLPAGMRAAWNRSIVYRAAVHMHRERGMPVGMAIASALNWARAIVRTGDVKQWPGPQQVNPKSVAECRAALALWESMKATARTRRTRDMSTPTNRKSPAEEVAPMLRAYQMPLVTDLATKVGPRLWRKTILRAGTIRKDGQELVVDRAKLAAYVASFNAGALDQVPFVLVDEHNRHVDDPQRYRGAIRGLELTADDRLEALIETTDAGSRLVDANPGLGVSVRIAERFERADGRAHGPTLLHVAGTLDPEISRLGAWHPADLSAASEVIDLTTPDPPAAPGVDDLADPGGPTTPAPKETPTVADTLTADELARLRALLDRVTTPDTQQPDGETPELSDADLDALAAAVLDEADAAPEQTAPPELVAASTERDLAGELDLANARAETQSIELARLRSENDRRAYETERDDLARTFGIPPRITDLARPLLEGSGRTVDLSGGRSADVGQVMRNVLRELGRTYKALDLSAETGSAIGVDIDGDAAVKTERDEFLTQARAAGFGV